MRKSTSFLFSLLVAITLGVYATMLFWSIPVLNQDAGGLAIFVMRPGGYSFEDARAILTGLSPEGVAFYKTVQHRLDALYPVLLAATIGWSILRFSPAFQRSHCALGGSLKPQSSFILPTGLKDLKFDAI